MTSPSRLHSLRPYLAVAVVPVVLALLAMELRVAVLLGAMWVVLVLTIGIAATSPGQDKPNSYHPRGRLHG